MLKIFASEVWAVDLASLILITRRGTLTHEPRRTKSPSHVPVPLSSSSGGAQSALSFVRWHEKGRGVAMAKVRGVTAFTALLAAAILACGDEAADEVGGAGSGSCPAQEPCEAPSPPFVGDIGIRYVDIM